MKNTKYMSEKKIDKREKLPSLEFFAKKAGVAKNRDSGRMCPYAVIDETLAFGEAAEEMEVVVMKSETGTILVNPWLDRGAIKKESYGELVLVQQKRRTAAGIRYVPTIMHVNEFGKLFETTGHSVVHKYPLNPEERQTLSLPVGAEVLSVAMQGDQAQLWAKVDSSQKELEERVFLTVGTGEVIKSDAELTHSGILMVAEGQMIFHVFEEKR